MGRVIFSAALVAALIVSSDTSRAQGPERFSGPSSQSILQIFDEYWEWKIAHRPELATQAGRREHNARWTDRSKAARDKDQYDLREDLQRAMWFSPGTLTPAMRLSAYLLECFGRVGRPGQRRRCRGSTRLCRNRGVVNGGRGSAHHRVHRDDAADGDHGGSRPRCQAERAAASASRSGLHLAGA